MGKEPRELADEISETEDLDRTKYVCGCVTKALKLEHYCAECSNYTAATNTRSKNCFLNKEGLAIVTSEGLTQIIENNSLPF